MPRKVTKKLQRELKPDRKYQSILVQRLINKSMLDGKKLVAERAVYSALEQAAKKLESEDPLEVFEKALKNVSPNFEVKSRRVGGATYQVPIEVRPAAAQRKAMRWIKDAASNRNDKTMDAKLASELMDAHNERGAAVKRREETHKMAEANKAFAHFRW